MASVGVKSPSALNRDNAVTIPIRPTDTLRSIRTPLLIVLVLSVVVPAALVVTLSSLVNVNNATNRAYEQMETVSALKTSQIGFWANLLQDELSTIAIDSEHLLLVRQAVPDSAFPTLRESAQDDLFMLYRQLVFDTAQFDSLGLVTADGSLIVGTEQAVPQFSAIEDPQAGDIYLTGPVFNEAANDFLMSAWYPVFDGERFLAFLGGQADLSTVYAILQDETGTGAFTESYLVDEQGRIILSGDEVFVDDGFEYVRGETTVALPETGGLADVRRLSVFDSHRDQNVIGLVDTTLPLALPLVTLQPQSDVLNAAFVTVLGSAALTVFAVLVVLALGVYFIERRLVQPIQTLSTTANQIAGGDLQQRATVQRSDEIGVLGQSFNSMTDQLAKSINTLEERVEERTAELVVARDAAEQANDAKSAFLASTSHELRTPLNAVLNFAGFIKREKWGPVTAEQADALDTIMRSGRYLLNLINDLLDMSKIASGSLEIYESEVNLNDEIAEVIELAQGLIEEQDIELITDIDPDLPLTIGDGIRIRQVMINLVSNAVKFTEEGQVRLVASHDAERFHFQVEDTGHGIAPEDKEAVFAAFRQTESGLRTGKGTGLGMPISKSLVEAHNGQLWFESVYGEGTTFHLELPLKQPSPAVTEASLAQDA